MPSLSISQNFIKNPRLIAHLLETASINKTDTVYDIGAGEGVITQELEKICAKVIAYELDSNLYSNLKKIFSNNSKVILLNENFLNAPLPQTPYKVFSNIPFNITSAIVNKLLFCSNPPIDCYLIMQKEAALRFLGTGEGTLISLLIKPFFEVSIAYEFKRNDFKPEPNVDTVLFNAKKRETPLISHTDMDKYRDFICYILLQQKSSLKNRVKKLFMPAQLYAVCQNLGVDPKKSAAIITFETWLKLFEYTLAIKDKNDLAYKLGVIKGGFNKYLTASKNQPKKHRTKVARNQLG